VKKIKINVANVDVDKLIEEIGENVFDAFTTYKKVAKQTMPLSRPLFLSTMCMLFDEYAAKHDDESVTLAIDALHAISNSPEIVVDEDEEDEEDDE